MLELVFKTIVKLISPQQYKTRVWIGWPFEFKTMHGNEGMRKKH